MKILTGQLKGHSIRFKPNPHLRPTSDKARKAIFDALQGALEDKSVLDLFSGTGALGFEALSNGAAQVTFVERHRGQARSIKENIEQFELADRSDVLCMDAFDAIKFLEKEKQFFDFVFLDPPYASQKEDSMLETFSSSSLIDASSIVVTESRHHHERTHASGPLVLIRKKIYGDTQISFWRLTE